MPKDYDLNAMAVSGLAGPHGKGKIGGAPEGYGESSSGDGDWRYMDGHVNKDGVIKGNPVGIEGEIRRAGSEGMASAVKRRLRG